MAKTDYYESLGVGRDADADEIKRAYRRLAMKHHPDRNPDDPKAEGKFKEIQAAYSCLSDEEKRAAYDRYGHAAFDGAGGGGGHNADFSSIFDDVFSDFFGGGGGRRQQRQQRILDMELTFEEMVEGCKKDMRLSLPQRCETCRGSGAKPGSRPTKCGTCGGEGQVRMQRGFFTVQQTCPTCRGAGQRIETPCETCRGKGKEMKNRRLSVTIPAGIDDGALMRVSVDGGDGDEELLLRVAVRAHPMFQRDGDNLRIEVPVAVTTAALGGEVAIPSVTGGKIKVNIPEGTQSGQLLRIAEHGVPNLRSRRRGSILCHIVVETPVKLSDKQKALLRDLDDSLKNRHSPREKSWLEKAKALFAE